MQEYWHPPFHMKDQRTERATGTVQEQENWRQQGRAGTEETVDKGTPLRNQSVWEIFRGWEESSKITANHAHYHWFC